MNLAPSLTVIRQMGSKALGVMLTAWAVSGGCAGRARSASPAIHESVFLGASNRETIEWVERSDGTAALTSIENNPWQPKAVYAGLLHGNGTARLVNTLSTWDVRFIEIVALSYSQRAVYTTEAAPPKGEWVTLSLVTDGTRLSVDRNRVPKEPYHWRWK